MPQDLIRPPQETTQDGKPRRLGVEIEFSGLSCREAGVVIANRFGGWLRQADEYRYTVEDTAYGTFTVELDSHYVHRGESAISDVSRRIEDARLGEAVDRGVRVAIGEVTRHYMPMEVVCPPIPIADIPKLDAAIADLRAKGARGSRDAVYYAFGLQINIEMPALDAATVLAYLQAYMVSADRLRSEIGIDLSRRALPFCQPLPPNYMRLVLEDNYKPEMARLIDDYLFHNPTRNRDLDMLPLFAWIDPDRVKAGVEDGRVHARPALHYRLPDSRIEDTDWFIVTEWNRWAKTVERLAHDPDRLSAVRRAYRRYLETGSWRNLTQEAMAWLRS